MICYNCFRDKPDVGACPLCGYDPAGSEEKYPMALHGGSILNGRYIVGRVLGQGGFGITYIAQDDRTKDRVAIKEYMPSELAGRLLGSCEVGAYSGDRKDSFDYGRDQFLEEAKTLAAFLGDEHIVRIHSYFEENGTAYFAMEYVDGLPLDKYMASRGGRLSPEEADDLLLPLMEALEEVHAKGIVHRDIAPDNIIVQPNGVAKLIDFGAARYSTGEKSKSLDVVIKHGFAPREQYMRRGRQGPFTDVYAMAATYYYAITGKLPPDAIGRMEEDELIPPEELGVTLTPATKKALYKGLEISASDRYQTMDAFHRAMKAARDGVEIEEEDAPAAGPAQVPASGGNREAKKTEKPAPATAKPAEQKPEKKKGHGGRTAVLVIAGLAAVAAGAFFFLRDRILPPPAEDASAGTAAIPAVTEISNAAASAAPTAQPVLAEVPQKPNSGELSGGQLRWTLDGNGVLIITGSGDMEDYSSGSATPWNESRDEVSALIVQRGVTSIGESAFRGCASLTSVDLPSGVTTIGPSAFRDCSGLTSLELPRGVTELGERSFDGCSGVTEVEIPDGVAEIDAGAFANCTALEHVTIPESVTSIGEGAFANCPALQTVEYGGTEQVWATLAVGENNEILQAAELRFAQTAPADATPTVSNLEWKLEKDTLTISGTGPMDNYSSTNPSPWHDSRGAIRTVVIQEGVTSIGSYAFYDSAALHKVKIPTGIKSIGNYAFANCNAISTMDMQNGVTSIGAYAFNNCGALTTAKLPTNLTTIGDYAFNNCPKLVTIKFPDGLTSIGKGAFAGCSNVVQLDVPSGVREISEGLFENCTGLQRVTIPESVTTIGSNAFKNSGMRGANLPEGVKSVGANAFANCSRLSEAKLPDTLTSLGAAAFSGCSRLDSIKIPASIKEIGDSAFSGCYFLKLITISEGVQIIGSNAFYGCSGVNTLTLPNTITTIGSNAFYRCSGLQYLTIPSSVQSIGGGAFYGCSSIARMTIPSGVKSIGDRTFYNCETLSSVTIPESVTSIGDQAFYGCVRISKMELPKGLTSLGAGAFQGCKVLQTINLPSGLTAIEDNTFSGCEALPERLEMPSKLTKIGSRAFENCRQIHDFTLPDGVTSIGSYAFRNCYALVNLTLPGTMREIGEGAFSGCGFFHRVYYYGDEASFRAISVGKDNDQFLKAKIEYQ